MKNPKSAAKLEHFKPFDGLSEEGTLLLRRGLDYLHFTGPDVVLQKGQSISGAYIVVGGRLRVYTLSPEGNEATLYTIHPGELCVLALNCLFNDLLYPAWVNATPATKVAFIPGALYRTLFESESAVRNITVQSFSTLVFRLMAELEIVHAYKLEQRLVRFLLLHAATDGSVALTQQEIASHLGSTREVIARLLRQLAARGYIQTKRNRVLLIQPKLLAASLQNTVREAPTKRPLSKTGRAPKKHHD